MRPRPSHHRHSVGVLGGLSQLRSDAAHLAVIAAMEAVPNVPTGGGVTCGVQVFDLLVSIEDVSVGEQ